MTEPSALLPCPFCGGEANDISDSRASKIACSECDAQTGPWYGYGRGGSENRERAYAKACEVWNTRAARPVDEAMVEKVARALFVHGEGEPIGEDTLNHWFSCTENSHGEDLGCWDHCEWLRGQARAALSAITPLPDEREKIVAWLRSNPRFPYNSDDMLLDLADAIERGDHLAAITPLPER